jgi:hypothetical protein
VAIDRYGCSTGVEAALELSAAPKDRLTAIAWRLAGFVVGDTGNVAGCRKIEAVDAAAYAQIRTRNDNRSQWIPRKCFALLWCEIAGVAIAAEWDLGPAPLTGELVRIRFGTDSLLEGDGFELPVPRSETTISASQGRTR